MEYSIGYSLNITNIYIYIIYIYIYIYGGVKFYQGSNSRGKIYVKYEMKYFCKLFGYFFF